MSTNPIDGLGSKPATPLSGIDNAESSQVAIPAKPVVKPPLERPFSLSLPPEKSTAETVVKNIDDSNKETEANTAKSAKEAQLKELLAEQQAKDRILNGPGTSGA